MSLLLKNGFVYDPLNGVNGEVMDILVEDGKIVERHRSKDLKVIDVSGMVVMPGGVDIHSHIAGSEVNAGRVDYDLPLAFFPWRNNTGYEFICHF